MFVQQRAAAGHRWVLVAQVGSEPRCGPGPHHAKASMRRGRPGAGGSAGSEGVKAVSDSKRWLLTKGTWEPGQLRYKGLIVAAHWIGNDL